MPNNEEPIDDGGSAFPKTGQAFGSDHVGSYGGMTLLDWYAGQSLTGIKSNPELLQICADVASRSGRIQQDAIADMAYQDAAAMIKQRKNL